MIALRRMEQNDCEAVYTIAKKTLPEHWSIAELKRVLQYDYNIYYVACRQPDGMIIGFVGIMVIAEDAELLNIAVEEQFQGQGIGLELLQCALDQAWEQHARRMLLEVRESNDRARMLYQRNGFNEIGTRKNYYTQPLENAVIMSCDRR